MTRPQRIEYPGAWYHVMNRGAQKRTTFLSTNDNLLFFDVIAEAVDRFSIEIHAYALMGNHYHLLVRTPESNLGRAMRHIGGIYTQRFNARHGIDGPLFRGRYKAILVDADDYLLSVSRYIHLNPVEAGLTQTARTAEWTSYPAYLGLEPAPRWLRIDSTLSMTGSRRDYERFVEQPTDGKVDAFYARSRLAPVLGSEQFRQRIEEQFQTDRTDRELEPVRADDHVILEQIEEALLKTLRLLGTTTAPVNNLAVAVLAREFGVSTSFLTVHLGYANEATCRSAISRLRRSMPADQVLSAAISQTRDELLNWSPSKRLAA